MKDDRVKVVGCGDGEHAGIAVQRRVDVGVVAAAFVDVDLMASVVFTGYHDDGIQPRVGGKVHVGAVPAQVVDVDVGVVVIAEDEGVDFVGCVDGKGVRVAIDGR